MTLDREDADLDTLFSKALGIKRSVITRRITQIKLMAWEQVLLIAMYARKQYESEPGSFHGRMGFIKLLGRSEFKMLRPHLLPLIDDGMSFLSIMESLKENLQTWGIDTSLYTWFKRDAESKGIAFAERKSPCLYSHYHLFIALTRFISICQEMLGLGASQKMCDDLAEAKLKQVFEHEIQFYNMPLGLENPDEPYTLQDQNEPITLQTLLGWQEKNPKDVSDLIMFIDTSIAKDIQKIFIKYFSIQNSDMGNQCGFCFNEEKNKKFPDWVQQHVDSEKNQYNLRLDITTLNRFMLMGQHEEIGKMLGDVLLEAVKDQLKLPQNHTPSNTNASPAEWQHMCTVLGLSRLDEVPPRIAAILYFDVQYMHAPIYTANFELQVKLEQQAKREQAEMITTYIIHHCLFNKGMPWDFKGGGASKHAVEKFKDIAKHSSDPLPDPMMASWANDTPSTVRSRFKKPLRDFKEGQNEIVKLIRGQMSKALVTPYPLQAGFPAPLWLPMPIQEIDESY